MTIYPHSNSCGGNIHFYMLVLSIFKSYMMNVFSDDMFFINGLNSLYEYMAEDYINFFDIGNGDVYMLDVSNIESYYCYDSLQLFNFCRKSIFSKKDSILGFHDKFLNIKYKAKAVDGKKNNHLTEKEILAIKCGLLGCTQRSAARQIGINEKMLSRLKISALRKMNFNSFSDFYICYATWERLWEEFQAHDLKLLQSGFII